VKGFSLARGMISFPAYGSASALFLHHQQDEEWATINRFPLLPDWKEMAA